MTTRKNSLIGLVPRGALIASGIDSNYYADVLYCNILLSLILYIISFSSQDITKYKKMLRSVLK